MDNEQLFWCLQYWRMLISLRLPSAATEPKKCGRMATRFRPYSKQYCSWCLWTLTAGLPYAFFHPFRSLNLLVSPVCTRPVFYIGAIAVELMSLSMCRPASWTWRTRIVARDYRSLPSGRITAVCSRRPKSATFPFRRWSASTFTTAPARPLPSFTRGTYC